MKPKPLTLDDIPEDLYAAIADKAYELGHVSAIKTLTPRFLKRAGDAFAAGRDNEAEMWRQLAKDCEAEAKQLRAAYDAKYPNP